LQWRMLPTHIPALNSAGITFKKVIDIIGGVKLGRVIYMEENYRAKFHINLEISSKFVRPSHEVFMMLFLSKKMNILTSKHYYFLSLPRSRNLQSYSFVVVSTEINVTCSVKHTRCQESSTNLQNMWQLISVFLGINI
jgi:hypothetical protein